MTYTPCKSFVKPELHRAAFSAYARCRILSPVPERTTFLGEWRRYRRLTQAQVVDRLAIHDDEKLPKTGASLSRLEKGKQPYGQRVLEALADIYGTDPASLLAVDPTKEGHIIDLLARMTPDDRERAEVMLHALAEPRQAWKGPGPDGDDKPSFRKTG